MGTTATGTTISRKREGDEGIHLAIDLSQGSALTWVAAELAIALTDLGQRVSLPAVEALSPTLDAEHRPRLASLMTEPPCRTFHVRLSHYWPQFFRQEVWGEVNAELFVTNYRFRGDIHPLDMWSRNLVANGVRKLAMSSFCRDSLLDLGVPADRCAVMPLGYSPQIEALAPRDAAARRGADRRILVVTNSNDLDRYGTDILIPALAKAFGPGDAVEIHIKDYGAASGSRTLRDLIAAQPSFPRTVWHTTFVAKEDLIRLYASMDLMVAPFRGEGFAMKILDAMAIGLPVMMPAFGGPMEYAPDGGFLPVEHAEVEVGPCYDTEHYLVGPGAYWCEVSEGALVAALRRYLREPAAADAAAAVARAHVHGRYTWRHAAQSLVTSLYRWHAEKDRRTARRRRPATLPLTVIMPTKDRPEELARTLEGYARQTTDGFEVIVVNDHGDGAAVRKIVATAGGGLRARVIDNDGAPGPGAARNLALEAAEGGVFLVTGDDIVPAPDLVARHREAHALRPEAEAAFVGRIDWHPALNLDWFMHHVVGAGSQQFNFRDLEPDAEVPFDRFYTSNVSWKRALTADLEQVFSESFRHAAYEDVELGYRLAKRGLRLRHLADAVGSHLHAMTYRSFFERMRRVGMMRTVLAAMHPRLVGDGDLAFYRDLEIERRRRAAGGAPARDVPWREVVEQRLTALDDLDRWMAAARPLSGAAGRQVGELEARVADARLALFDDLCATFARIGQAEEWALGSSASDWPAAWTAMLEAAGRGRTAPASVPAAVAPRRRRNRMKQMLLHYEFARSVREWLRQAKRRRHAAA